MGEKDTAGKLFVACPDVFAETVNSLVYKGQAILLESELIAAPTESFCETWERQAHGQFRDYGMYVVRGGRIWALYALENQSAIDKRMPLRQGMTGLHTGISISLKRDRESIRLLRSCLTGAASHGMGRWAFVTY